MSISHLFRAFRFGRPATEPPPATRSEARSRREWEAQHAADAAEHGAHRAQEAGLARGRSHFTTPGFCAVCRRLVPLTVDLKWGDGQTPNWRERLVCPCGLNSRTRATFDLLGELTAGIDRPRLYVAEQVTAFFHHLRQHYAGVVGSEFLRDGTARGACNSLGIRHEDATALTFADESFDVVMAFDVLEHVPGYARAIRELARVVAPGGHALLSFPFDPGADRTLIRASIDEAGRVVHHLPPEYHGDPLTDEGCLCFQVFGWDVLEELTRAGFRDAWTVRYWSAERGYLGHQMLVMAGK